MNALNKYYQRVGCSRGGVFPPYRSQPTITGKNGLGLSSSYLQHPPWVMGYQARIVDTGEETVTNNNNPKPIYVLEVLAQLSNKLTKQQVRFLQQQLKASLVWKGSTLVWRSLPNNQVSSPGSILWVLDGARRAFRSELARKNLMPENTTVASNCAN